MNVSTCQRQSLSPEVVALGPRTAYKLHGASATPSLSSPAGLSRPFPRMCCLAYSWPWRPPPTRPLPQPRSPHRCFVLVEAVKRILICGHRLRLTCLVSEVKRRRKTRLTGASTAARTGLTRFWILQVIRVEIRSVNNSAVAPFRVGLVIRYPLIEGKPQSEMRTVRRLERYALE
ncbi:hypothetical protein BGZ61DRAFT_238751, partial [Ilyonectria robusta]|uniref:uncharacterized protein n=1 Tax=Ilyonectria robusta TaxID=1079257 RepID=UPI001E8CCC90